MLSIVRQKLSSKNLNLPSNYKGNYVNHMLTDMQKYY